MRHVVFGWKATIAFLLGIVEETLTVVEPCTAIVDYWVPTLLRSGADSSSVAGNSSGSMSTIAALMIAESVVEIARAMVELPCCGKKKGSHAFVSVLIQPS